jgi:6-phosphogluconate dehydrogenase
MPKNIAIVLMGVAGVGKTTIGLALSKAGGIPFFDGDDYHSSSNRDKMAAGKALSDEDRTDWLLALQGVIENALLEGNCILACSALKKAHRAILEKNSNAIHFVYLEGSKNLIEQRLANRIGHYFPASLLASQLETLEPPENAFTVSITQSPSAIVEMIMKTLLNQNTSKAAIGLIGLGVMGKALTQNFVRNGISVSVYNRELKGVEELVAKNFVESLPLLKDTQGFCDYTSFIDSLQSPKKIFLMIEAGAATETVLSELAVLLNRGDIIVDLGNTFYKETETHIHHFATKGIHLIGAGISGGEQGALNGASIMPSGNKEAYALVAPYLNCIAAKDKNNQACSTYIGEGGTGHFVKMVHNGIEYAEMQLLAEIYSLARAAGKNPSEIAAMLSSWKQDKLDSFLLNTTIDILNTKEGNDWLIDKIVDASESKGTGTWATNALTNAAIPASLIANALYARQISSYKNLRVELEKNYPRQKNTIIINEASLKNAYHFTKIIIHFQGFWLLDEFSKNHHWNLNLSEIARIWTRGCIIQSDFMETLVPILKITPTILLDTSIAEQIKTTAPAATEIVIKALENKIATAILSDAIQFFNAISTAHSTANLIQAQRDYFGAHTFLRIGATAKEHYAWGS